MNYLQTILLTSSSLLIFESNSSCNAPEYQSAQKDHNETTITQPTKNESSVEKQGTGTTTKPCGIYVATDWQKPIPDYVFKDANVDGVIIRLYWKDLQPSYDKFDWTLLDSGCKQAISSGKKIWIAVTAGKHSPEWIYQHKVRKLNFTEAPHEGKAGKMIQVDVPVVWDKDYVDLWKNLIKKLADHLKADQPTWDAITMMKITGINERTDEIRLPAQNELTNAKGKTSHAANIWKGSGYKPELVFKVWQQFLDEYAINFPNKVLSIAIIPGHAFPTIDTKGDVVARKQAHDLTQDMIDDGIARYKGIFAVQFNSLYLNTGANKLVVQAGKRGAIIGFQLKNIALANPDCLTNNSACDEEMFQNVLDYGINNGACWLEIFQKNVLAYPKSIAQAHNKLTKR